MTNHINKDPPSCPETHHSESLMAYSYAILVCLPVIVMAYLFIRKRNDERVGILLPPGPRKLPVIGNLHQLGTLLHHSFWELSRKHGPLMLLQLGTKPTLVISSAELAREVLQTHDLNFCSRPELFASTRYSYGCKDVVFSPYGSYWREIRKICILELFSLKRVESFSSVRQQEVSLMIDVIAQSSSAPVNLSKMVAALSNAIICRVGMGMKFQDGEAEIPAQAQLLLGGFFMADYFPSFGWVDRLTGALTRLEKNLNELDKLYEKVIDEHLDPKRETSDHEDLVDVLLRLQRDGANISRDGIKGIIMDIFIAGTDTSSATLVWAMTELIRNPRLMKKAQEEIRASVGNKGKVEVGDLESLPYLKSVVKETLRLRSPVPLLLPRENARHCKIGGYDILPNTRVYINSWRIGRDPKVWDDPEEFIPERFMDGSVDFKGQDFQYIPFGSGRRICPAMNLGFATVEHALANLLYSFEWELPHGMSRDDIDMNEEPGITVHKKVPLHLVATKYCWN